MALFEYLRKGEAQRTLAGLDAGSERWPKNDSKGYYWKNTAARVLATAKPAAMLSDLVEKRPFLKSYEKTPASFGFVSKKLRQLTGKAPVAAPADAFIVQPHVKEKSKAGRELADLAQEIRKIRNLLAEQLSHDHGTNNLKEARSILSKRLAQYASASKQRLLDLDAQERRELNALPAAQSPEATMARDQAVTEIQAKYAKFRANLVKRQLKQSLASRLRPNEPDTELAEGGDLENQRRR